MTRSTSRASTALARLATRHGLLVLAAIALVTALAAVGYARLEFSSSPEVLALRGSRALDFYREYLRRWGSDELVVLAYAVPDAFAPAELARLRALTGAIGELPHVRSVTSLDTLFRIEVGPFGPYPTPLVPDEIAGAAEIRARALASPFARGAFVSEDGRTLLLSVQLEGRELENSAAEREALAGIERVLAAPGYRDLEVHLAGAPVFDRELARMNRRDNARMTPLAVALVAVGSAWIFHSLLAAGCLVLVVGVAVVWTLGLLGATGVPLTLTTSLLPPLLLVVGIAEGVHLLARYLDRLGSGEPRERALESALDSVFAPCFWTAVSTAAGFASLGTVRIESVRDFSTFAVVGVGFAFALTFLLLPALLVRAPLERAAARRSALAARGALHFFARPHPRLALVCALGALAVGAYAIPRVEVATHDGEFFEAGHPLNRAYRFMEERLGGVTPFEVEVDAGAAGDIRSARALAGFAELQARLAEVPELTPGLSIVDLLLATSPGTDLGSDASVARGLFLLESLAPDDLGAFVDPEHRRGRIAARAVAMTSARAAEVVEGVERDGAAILGPGFQVRATGLVPVFSQVEQALVQGQVESYGLALLAVLATFALAFRSLPIALIALVPNTIPVLFAAGVMVALGIRLDVATVMVASTTLGLIDDDTIHLVHAYLRGRSGSDASGALEHALRVAGQPTLLASAILAGGFAVLALSDFVPTRHFGALVAFTVATAVVADLIVLPALLARVAPALAGSPRTRTQEVPG